MEAAWSSETLDLKDNPSKFIMVFTNAIHWIPSRNISRPTTHIYTIFLSDPF